MKLYIFRQANADELSDTHKVFAWFLTMIYRDVGINEVVTIDWRDFQYLYYGTSGRRLLMDDIAEEPLSKIFHFANLGPRIAIKIKDEAIQRYKKMQGKKTGKMGVTPHYVTEEGPCRVAAYLHAALNFMPNWYMDPDVNIFDDITYKGRFTPDAKQHRTIQEVFAFENMVDYNRHGKRGTGKNAK